MNLFLSSFLSFVLLYKYWALFIIVLSSSFLLPLPTNTILVATGAFASQGYMDISVILFLAIIVNVLTDCFAFFLTYRYGKIIIDKFIPKWDGKVFSVEKYLRNYAFGTIFLTRIAGPFAPYVNFLSGLIGVRFKKFLLADFLGNTIGTIFFVSAGYVLGNYWEIFIDDIWLITLAIFVLLLIYFAYKFYSEKKENQKK